MDPLDHASASASASASAADTATATATASDWVHYSGREVLGTTLLRAHFDTHRFERHSHEFYSVGLTTSGVQSFRCGGGLHHGLPGDFILFNPDQAHDGHKGTPEGFGYTMLQVPVATMQAHQDQDAGRDLGRYFKVPVVRDAALARTFLAAVAAMEQPGETLRGQELWTAFVAELMARHGEHACGPGKAKAQSQSEALLRLSAAKDYLAAHFHRDVEIAELADQTQLSRSHLTRAFTACFGVPPHVWLNAVRLSHARRMLLEGQRLAEVALACGFADQSHFTRRFKGAMGVSPAQWRQMMRRRP